MKQYFYFLFTITVLFCVLACNKEDTGSDSTDCCPITCWGKGTLDASACDCQCEPGFGGAECDSILFQQGMGLRFNTYKLDYMQTAMPEDVVELDCLKYIKKGSNNERFFQFVNVAATPVVIKNVKGSIGALIPTYPKDPIAPGATDSIEVRYDTNRTGEKLAWVEVSTNQGDYRLMVKVRVAE